MHLFKKSTITITIYIFMLPFNFLKYIGIFQHQSPSIHNIWRVHDIILSSRFLPCHCVYMVQFNYSYNSRMYTLFEISLLGGKPMNKITKQSPNTFKHVTKVETCLHLNYRRSFRKTQIHVKKIMFFLLPPFT